MEGRADSLKKINKIDKPLEKLTKKKERTQIINIKNEQRLLLQTLQMSKG